MIQGRFVPKASGGAPSPQVLTAVRLDPDAGFQAIDFLLDTGADYTAIHPADALRLWPNYLSHDFLNDPTLVSFGGIGGSASFVTKKCDLYFVDDQSQAISASDLEIRVAAPYEKALWGFPSLLGRDVLQFFKLTMDQRRAVFTLEPSP